MIPVLEIETPHPYPPRITAFTRRFWDALGEGRLLTTQSASTGRLTFPPKPISPEDWSADMEWIELGGRGKVYSYTRIHAAPAAFADDVPYAVCIVDLDEGLRLATRLVGDYANVAIGMTVEIVAVRHSNCVVFAARPMAEDVGD
jgi:uncharacterized protein